MKTTDAFGQDRVSYNSIQVDNLKIFYREAWPKDGPVILLLHGVPTSSRMYESMLESSFDTKYRLRTFRALGTALGQAGKNLATPSTILRR